MKLVVLSMLLYLVGSYQVQAKESTGASSKCPAPKQIAFANVGFAVQLNQPIVHIYVVQYNAYLVLNTELKWAIIIYGNNKTFFSGDVNVGFGGMFNLKTNIVYVLSKNLEHFNLSEALEGNYTVALSLIDYTYKYIDKVIGSDIDTTQPGYANASTLLHDYATTTDYSKWVSYNITTKVNTCFFDSNVEITKAMNNVLQSNAEYSVEWGPVIFYVVASEEYKKEEECQTAFIDVMMKLVKDYDMDFDSALMEQLYDIVSKQKYMTKQETIQRYEALLEKKLKLLF